MSSNLQNLSIHTVLVRPIYPRNVGQSVRATMNMGYGKVFLIDPQCEIDEQARQGAAGAQKELEERTTYKSFNEFNEAHPNTFRIGLTRRIGKHRKLFPFDIGVKSFFNAQTEKLGDKFNSAQKDLFLVFGPEDHGLSTEDLEHVNMCCHLPLYGEFKSLNLAHAVLISQHLTHHIYFDSYIQKSDLKKEKKTMQLQSSEDKGRGDFFEDAASESFFPDEALLGWLKTMGFQIDPKRLNAFETLKKMILRGFPSPKELGTLEKALKQSTKKLNQ